MLGQRLRAVRKQRGYTQAELADKVGVSQFTLSHYENGTRNPPIDVLTQLADALGTSADYLLGREETDEFTAVKTALGTMPIEYGQGLGARLRTVREARYLSPAQCALLMGIKDDQWRAWEAGDQVPPLAELLQVANLLHASLDWLLGRQDPTLFGQHDKTDSEEQS
ncbi:MAG: hypothetical protein C7B44_06900 [Sulfobacillus thermosulfidooxidans]|nr:MAG: hypothetical protein C7B44_06900 [Sulfobacillus thermosulfidooxidans]